jgi:hypothetical protein
VLDALPRRGVLVGADLVRGVVAVLLAFVFFTDGTTIGAVTISPWIALCVGGAIFGAADGLFIPTVLAAVPDLVPEKDIARADALLTASEKVGLAVGPVIGATLLALGGPALAFAANGMTFFASAICVGYALSGHRTSTLTSPQTAAANADKSDSIWRAFQILGRTPWLWVTIGLALFINMGHQGTMYIVLPLIVSERFAGNAAVLGLAQGCIGAGGLIVSLLIAARGQFAVRGRLAYCAWGVTGLAVMALAIPSGALTLYTAALIYGSSQMLFCLIWVNTVQTTVATADLGRVFAIDYLASGALVPLAYILSTAIADRTDPSTAALAGGGLAFFCVAIGLLHPRVRNFR